MTRLRHEVRHQQADDGQTRLNGNVVGALCMGALGLGTLAVQRATRGHHPTSF